MIIIWFNSNFYKSQKNYYIVCHIIIYSTPVEMAKKKYFVPERKTYCLSTTTGCVTIDLID